MELTSELIQQYNKYTTPQLKTKAQTVFNSWIRKRDLGLPCINCGNYRKLQAGHFFAAGPHNNIRFHEHNVNGECLQCNFYNSQSHAHGYKPNLIKKIGQENFDKLEMLSKIRSTKDDRFLYIEIIQKYK
jgi:Bacteriophage Lambda NinG protein